MKVEVDADELCELRKRASLTVDACNIAHSGLATALFKSKVDVISNERDFWKEKCESACRWYDAVLAEARAAHNHRVVSAETRFNDWQTEASNIGLNR